VIGMTSKRLLRWKAVAEAIHDVATLLSDRRGCGRFHAIRIPVRKLQHR